MYCRIIISNRHALVQLDNGGIGRIAVVVVTTDIDVLGEQLVRHLVLLQDVVVGPRAREGGAEEEAEDPAVETNIISQSVSCGVNREE